MIILKHEFKGQIIRSINILSIIFWRTNVRGQILLEKFRDEIIFN